MIPDPDPNVDDPTVVVIDPPVIDVPPPIVPPPPIGFSQGSLVVMGGVGIRGDCIIQQALKVETSGSVKFSTPLTVQNVESSGAVTCKYVNVTKDSSNLVSNGNFATPVITTSTATYMSKFAKAADRASFVWTSSNLNVISLQNGITA